MYLTQISWKFHWDQAIMDWATASKALRGQIHNLHTYWLWIHLNWFRFFWFTAVKLWVIKKKLLLLKDIFQFDTCNFPNVMRLFELNLWDWNNAFSYYCLWWEQCEICKFWIWPLVTSMAVAEAMIAWSQWNFQQKWLRY